MRVSRTYETYGLTEDKRGHSLRSSESGPRSRPLVLYCGLTLGSGLMPGLGLASGTVLSLGLASGTVLALGLGEGVGLPR
jgi:hypothetical protein